VLGDAFRQTRIAAEITAAPFAATLSNYSGGEFVIAALAKTEDGAELIAPPVKFTLHPANDAFLQAKTLSGYSTSLSGWTAGATREPKEPAHGGGAAHSSVWYSWTAPASGPANFGVYAEEVVFNLGVYSGDGLQSLRRVPGTDSDHRKSRGYRAG
jgi:hypothetical protein